MIPGSARLFLAACLSRSILSGLCCTWFWIASRSTWIMTVRSEGKRAILGEYRHEDWRNRRRFIRFLLNTAGRLLMKVDKVEGMENVPPFGSAIIMINHIGFVDPIVVLNVLERDIVPLTKREVYLDPIIGVFPKIWGAIPVKRGEVDRDALRRAFAVLDAGEILLVAPEGTRNPQLQRGKEGIAYIASRSGTPIVPATLEHTEAFPTFWFVARPNEPGAHVRFGKPFRFRVDTDRPDRELMRKMTDEALYVLAEMLPLHRRGVYADLSKATRDTIAWM